MIRKLIQLTILLAGILTASSAIGVEYYQNRDGKIARIDEATFRKCDSVIYRTMPQNQLPPDLQRDAIAAALKAETVNDLASVRSLLKSKPGSCTYGTDSEKLAP